MRQSQRRMPLILTELVTLFNYSLSVMEECLKNGKKEESSANTKLVPFSKLLKMESNQHVGILLPLNLSQHQFRKNKRLKNKLLLFLLIKPRILCNQLSTNLLCLRSSQSLYSSQPISPSSLLTNLNLQFNNPSISHLQCNNQCINLLLFSSSLHISPKLKHQLSRNLYLKMLNTSKQ